MGLNRATDRYMFVTEAKTTGGASQLTKGVLAVVDMKNGTKDGPAVINSFLGFPKTDKRFAIQSGTAGKSVNRSASNKSMSSRVFSLAEIKKLEVSVPNQKEQTLEEVVIGYDGFNAESSFKFRKGQSPFNFTLQLEDGGLSYRGGGSSAKEILQFSHDIPGCDPGDDCEECVSCAYVDCKLVTDELIERIRAHEITGGGKLIDHVDVTPVYECDSDAPTATVLFSYYTLTVCDTGDDEALSYVAKQYDFPVKRISRKGNNSTYEVLTPDTDGAPDDYEQGIPSLLKGCDDCPAGFTATADGFVYAISIEDDGADRSSVITSNLAAGKYVSGTIQRSETGTRGFGFYVAKYSSKITVAEIASFTGSTANNRNTAEITYAGKSEAFCTNGSTVDTAWVKGETCGAIEETFEIILPDTVCGVDVLDQLQKAYPDFDVQIATTGESVLELTLTGTSGTANINVGGTDYLATFNTDLATTASDFVTAHAATILTDWNVVVTANAEVLSFEGEDAVVNAITITNDTPDLDGTLVVTANLAKKACKTKYTATVISNLVCDECDDIYKDYFVTDAPEPFGLKVWEKTGGTVADNCKCGIRFKAKPFSLVPNEALRDQIAFMETSTLIRVAAGYPGEIREGIGFIEKGIYTGEHLFRRVLRTHLMGNLRAQEIESRAYFLGETTRHDYLGRILRNEESVVQDDTEQMVQYSIELGHEAYSQGFAGKQEDNIKYVIAVPYGSHNSVENLLNNMAAAADIPSVKA